MCDWKKLWTEFPRKLSLLALQGWLWRVYATSWKGSIWALCFTGPEFTSSDQGRKNGVRTAWADKAALLNMGASRVGWNWRWSHFNRLAPPPIPARHEAVPETERLGPIWSQCSREKKINRFIKSWPQLPSSHGPHACWSLYSRPLICPLVIHYQRLLWGFVK